MASPKSLWTQSADCSEHWTVKRTAKWTSWYLGVCAIAHPVFAGGEINLCPVLEHPVHPPWLWTAQLNPILGATSPNPTQGAGGPVDIALTRPLLVQGGWVWTLVMLYDIKHIKAYLDKMDVTFNGDFPDSQFCPIVKAVLVSSGNSLVKTSVILQNFWC